MARAAGLLMRPDTTSRGPPHNKLRNRHCAQRARAEGGSQETFRATEKGAVPGGQSVSRARHDPGVAGRKAPVGPGLDSSGPAGHGASPAGCWRAGPRLGQVGRQGGAGGALVAGPVCDGEGLARGGCARADRSVAAAADRLSAPEDRAAAPRSRPVRPGTPERLTAAG